ncbi:RuBisCO accumulation factor 1 [Chroococcidiopsis sp.]|uniref:RuBisCO accumulation factor 1 n=1 Tax=Chroococcidiopsis sp. TaxID=3088168 RepID=UPI003F34FF88
MTESPSNQLDIEATLTSLRQKQGSWVEWGQAIAQLQKAGQTPQQIFEATGFEPVQQNQVIVGAQVYASLEKTNASEAVRSRFTQKGSDILYELRLLNNAERVAAAEFILAHNLDADMAKEVARDMKEFSRLRSLPEGFANHAGDAIAYQCWRLARQKSDLQERSRLIAKGLRFADSDTARQKIEQLLVDFTVVPKRPAPTIPFYRPDSEDHLPRLIPVVGEMPLKSAEVQAVPIVEAVEPFQIVKFAGEQAWVALPGWQTVRSAEDPIAILCQSDRLPNQSATASEPVLIIADRHAREWDVNSYFVYDASGEVDFGWFETQPDVKLLGKIVVVVRPKHIIDEELTKDSWQIDE